MLIFEAEIKKFGQKGEKTGWTYIEFSAELANQICPNTKTSFRIKGTLDNLDIAQTTLLPMGDGTFILPINYKHRKALRVNKGSKIRLSIEHDDSPLTQSDELLTCLQDEPAALEYFEKLPPSHQRYFSNWVEEAKTIETKSRRIAMCVHGMALGMDYGQMMRHYRDKKM